MKIQSLYLINFLISSMIVLMEWLILCMLEADKSCGDMKIEELCYRNLLCLFHLTGCK